MSRWGYLAEAVIVGIDPGITVGLAIIDLNMNLILTKSIKNARKEDIINHIVSSGRPVVIATDVMPAPEFVTKIAANFNARLYVPEKPVSLDEKIRITREFDSISDSHMRDSLAAAILAYGSIKKTLSKIERVAEEHSLNEKQKDILSILVLRNECPNIESGLKEILEEKRIEEEIKSGKTVPIRRRKFYTLQKDYEILWGLSLIHI